MPVANMRRPAPPGGTAHSTMELPLSPRHALPSDRPPARSARRLSATRAAASFTESCARWAYRAVVRTFRWPRRLPIIDRLSPSARARDAKLCRRS